MFTERDIHEDEREIIRRAVASGEDKTIREQAETLMLSLCYHTGCAGFDEGCENCLLGLDNPVATRAFTKTIELYKEAVCGS